jgi:hypothetical protein
MIMLRLRLQVLLQAAFAPPLLPCQRHCFGDIPSADDFLARCSEVASHELDC